MGAAVAVVLAKERRVVDAFLRARATSPERAVAPEDLGVDLGGVGGRRLLRHAALREAAPGRYYLDEPTWHEAPWPLHAAPGRPGELWLVLRAGLYHSADGGLTFEHVPSEVHVDALALGKAPEGRDAPALFAIGTRENLKAIWRSDDSGRSWVRVNDDQHQYGTRFRCIAGDPRIFGRVYVGTDGRGVLYGEPLQR